MNKDQIDELYHLLRLASNMKGTGLVKTGLFVHEEVNTIYGIAKHLLAGGDYPALVRFSMYYGERFLCLLGIKEGYFFLVFPPAFVFLLANDFFRRAGSRSLLPKYPTP